MDLYLLLKLAHVLAAIVAVGTNVTYFFWLRQAKSAGPDAGMALSGITRLDRRIANPAYVVLPVTGVVMVVISRLEFSTFWIAAGIVLFIAMGAFAGIAFAPALRRQVQLAKSGTADASEYATASRRTTVTGVVTMVLVFAIVTLMVIKPG